MVLLNSLLCSLLLYSSLLAEEEAQDLPSPQEFHVNLKEPTFSHGIISTNQGGVVTAKNVRIQAQRIEYINRIEEGKTVKRVTAEGDLMLEFNGSYFVGERLEYDFETHTGTLWEGKTFTDIWFVGGEKIALKEDGSYNIYNAYITTSESQANAWDVHAGAIKITKDKLLSAKNIQFRFIKIPFFWVPSFKSNLKMFKDPPIKYKLTWDKGLGPRVTLRYRVFSWNDIDLFFRFDYRWKLGPGAAVEGKYRSLDKRTVFLMKNYLAKDKEVPDENGKHRFRLQGLYETTTLNNKTHVHLLYDRISDDKMPSDFKSDDFEINTQKRTRLLITDKRDRVFSSFSLQPRINSFQSLDQELPLIKTSVHPFEIGASGILFENAFSGGYLDYVYTKDIQQFIPHRQAFRLETTNTLYRPFRTSTFTLTPYAGFIGIFYSQSTEHHPLGQAIFSYGATGKTHFCKSFTSYRHQVEPYFSYQGLTHPPGGTNRPFIFSIDDGFASLNKLRIGVKNLLFKRPRFLPFLENDTYFYTFFHKDTFANAIPKAYTEFSWKRPFLHFHTGIGYNIEETLWDYTNFRGDFTVNEHFAFGLEFRHRSRFDWRKADRDSFILEVARPLSELLDSPESDGRDTILSKAFIRLTPNWTLNLQSHHGWGRRSEPNYNEILADLYTMITSFWQLRLSYRYLPNDPYRFTAGLSLVK